MAATVTALPIPSGLGERDMTTPRPKGMAVITAAALLTSLDLGKGEMAVAAARPESSGFGRGDRIVLVSSKAVLASPAQPVHTIMKVYKAVSHDAQMNMICQSQLSPYPIH